MDGLVGVVHYALFPSAGSGTDDLTGTFDVILEDGFFGAIEITWMNDERVRRKAARILQSTGLQVMFSGGPALLPSGLNLAALSESERKRAVDLGKTLVDQAYELGARNLLLASGPDPGAALRTSAIDAFKTSLEELCEYALSSCPRDPLVITVEPFDRDVHWRQLLGPTALSAAVIGEVRTQYKNCGITLDMSHVAQLNEGIEDAVRDAGDCLVHAHIANCVLERGDSLYGDLHPHFDVENGVYMPKDVSRFLDALDSSGFFSHPCPCGKPVVSFEIKPVAGQDPAAILRDCKTYVRGWKQR